MTNLPQASQTDFHRVVLLASGGTRLLVIPENGRFRLPTLAAPKDQRLAVSLTTLLESRWSQRAVCLFRLDTAPITSDFHYHVMECSDENPTVTPDSHWVSVSSLEELHFQEALDYVAVVQSLAQCRAFAEDCKHAPFARIGWFSELTSWVREEAARQGLKVSGQFSQLNACPAFSLVRFETDGPALWFKAVGEPNLREYPITLALANYFPSFVLHILASRADWNGWLTVEAEGTHPDGSSPRNVWTTIAATLADLQIASIGRTLHLVDAGCHDLRVCALTEVVEPFFDAMTELMGRQTTPSPPPLSYRDLVALRGQLQVLLHELRESHVPNTLGHLDFNPGNIAVSRDRCVFLDWAEACVGHPFLTLAYLLEVLHRLLDADRSWQEQIISTYTEPWKCFVDPVEIAHSLALIRPLAVFAYAVSCGAWRDPVQRARPEIARHLRSLTRRMKREMESCLAPETQRRVTCPN
jgi:hypothetical protein